MMPSCSPPGPPRCPLSRRGRRNGPPAIAVGNRMMIWERTFLVAHALWVSKGFPERLEGGGGQFREELYPEAWLSF